MGSGARARFGGESGTDCVDGDPSGSVVTMSVEAMIVDVVALQNSGSCATSRHQPMWAGSQGSIGTCMGFRYDAAVGANTLSWDAAPCASYAHTLVAFKRL